MEHHAWLRHSTQHEPKTALETARAAVKPWDRGVENQGHAFPARPLHFSSVTLSPAEETNVCQQQQHVSSDLTQTLGPLSASDCTPYPLSVTQPSRAAPRAPLQWEPQRSQSHQLLSRSLLPASDRTHQGDGDPGAARPVAQFREGFGLLHSGSKGNGRFAWFCQHL